jgi:HEAT repeat protein
MKRILPWMFTASLLALPLAAWAAQPPRVDLLCHRTANEDMPENTLESLEQAALLGCDLVEIDLRRTLDGKIVLNHDGFLERLTDGHGEVESTFYDDLRMRDAGSWMSDRFEGLRIVLFEDALRLARDRGIRLYLDMKDKGMGTEVLAILRREQMLDRVEFGGEWEDVKALDPQANQSAQNTQWVTPEVTPEEIAALHRKGKRVVVNFSANQYEMDLARMKMVVAAGADAINVDFPRIGADAVGRPVEARLSQLMLKANQGASDQRIQAILELGRYQGLPLANAFAHWLLDQNEAVSRAAAVALVKMRPAVELSLFAEALRSPHASARVNAVWALGALHAPASTVLTLLKDSSLRVVSETLVALAHMPGEVPAESLLPLLSDPDCTVRGAAAVALARHQPMVAASEVPKQLRLEAAAEEVVYHRHKANGGGPFNQAEIDAVVAGYRCQMQMLRALHVSNQPSSTSELVAQAFGSDDVFPEPNRAVAAMMLWDRIAADPATVVRELSSEDTQAADRAEWILVKAGPAVLPDVRNDLDSKNQDVRQRAIRIVAWQGDTISLAKLQALRAMNGPDSALVAWAIAKIELLHPELK